MIPCPKSSLGSTLPLEDRLIQVSQITPQTFIGTKQTQPAYLPATSSEPDI